MLCKVLAWTGVIGALLSLCLLPISDVHRYDTYSHSTVVESSGIGMAGVAQILIGAVLQFVILIGLSQVLRLLIDLATSHAQRDTQIAGLNMSVTELLLNSRKLGDQLRMVGSMVYEEAKKEER